MAGGLAERQASAEDGEQQYRSLFTAMEQGFCIIEKVEVGLGQPSDFRYVAANPAFERHTGLFDAVGKTIRQLVPEAEQSIIDRYDQVVRTGEPQRFEAYVSALDLWMDADVFPVAEPNRIAVLFTNISDRKRTEATLHANEQRQVALLKLSDAQRTVSDPSEFRRAAMSVIGEQLGLARAHFFDAERDADGGWTHVIERGYQRDSDALEFVGRYSLRDFGSWMFEGFAGGEPVAIANIET
ncbi:MAG: PAS domain-containing protein, partial [Caulobacteraceae bacterium]